MSDIELKTSRRTAGDSRQPIRAKKEGPQLRIQQGDAGKGRWYHWAIQWVVRVLFLLFFRVRVAGRKNVPRKPAIICANHLGWADPFLVLLFFPVEPRIHALADAEAVTRTAFRIRFMNLLQVVVPLDPQRTLAGFRLMEEVLQRGGSLLIFPEGAPEPHTQPEEGRLRELFQGAARISVLTGVPILPVGIGGTLELWLRKRLVMRIGRPIDPQQFEGDPRTRTRALTERLARDLRALMPPVREQKGPRLLRRWLTGLFS